MCGNDPGRTDVYAPAGGQSLLRLVPAIGQLRGWDVISIDVKDAYLMCEQPRLVKVILDAKLAGELGIRREWILGKILPGQREGAAKWLENLKETLTEGPGAKWRGRSSNCLGKQRKEPGDPHTRRRYGYDWDSRIFGFQKGRFAEEVQGGH